MADQRQTCSHPGCNCPVNGDSFCSDQCRKQGSQASGESCQCGHPGCGDRQ